ncbi:hypothetical protein CEXT_309531 [Caerostris extrusa]|uniref:Uncharacterized protein n=1 Tax=Caerostris extrusa TaxID=172846 RepID=A0AAV4RG40_CAEEX|nr:hypothetical protein CEXT_309531 [Caerostris extrusa]
MPKTIVHIDIYVLHSIHHFTHIPTFTAYLNAVNTTDAPSVSILGPLPCYLLHRKRRARCTGCSHVALVGHMVQFTCCTRHENMLPLVHNLILLLIASQLNKNPLFKLTPMYYVQLITCHHLPRQYLES